MDAGYRQYETSNYAKRGMECRHNIGYWIRADYLGLGIGAASLISNVRYTNTSDMDEYLSRCRHIHDVGDDIFKANLHVAADVIDKKEQMEEFMFLGLRMTQGVSKKEFQEYFGTAIENIYGEVLKKYKKQGLLLEESGRIFLSREGIHVSNAVMADFLL